jgi:hypothetical protein
MMAENFVLTPEQQKLDEKHSDLLDLLGRVGWDFAGSGPNIGIGEPGAISMWFNYQTDITVLTLEGAAALLSDAESETGLLAGWGITVNEGDDLVCLRCNVLVDEVDDLVCLSYNGLVDESYERGVTALVEYAEAQAPSNE